MLRNAYLLILTCVGLSACAATPPFDTYEYAGFDLGAAVTGPLVLRDGCLAIAAETETVRAILPDGTRLQGETVRLPTANGAFVASVGESYTFYGGFSGPPGQEIPGTSCPQRGFIVNRIVN